MKVRAITTITDENHPGFLQFKKSLDKFGWDYELTGAKYQSYGSKMIAAYEYAQKTDCTHLFILDGYDIIVLGTMQEALDKALDKNCIMFNSEKGCWPYQDWDKLYPETRSPWKFLNGGAAFVEVQKFTYMMKENPIQHYENDQPALAKIFLTKGERYKVKLDTDCKVFQSIAFEHEDDFEYKDTRLFNKKTNSYPVILHGNGQTSMEKVYKLL